MKDYKKPEAEVVTFATEAIATDIRPTSEEIRDSD